MEKGGEEGEIQKRISDKRRVSLYSRDRRSHDLPESTRDSYYVHLLTFLRPVIDL